MQGKGVWGSPPVSTVRKRPAELPTPLAPPTVSPFGTYVPLSLPSWASPVSPQRPDVCTLARSGPLGGQLLLALVICVYLTWDTAARAWGARWGVPAPPAQTAPRETRRLAHGERPARACARGRPRQSRRPSEGHSVPWDRAAWSSRTRRPALGPSVRVAPIRRDGHLEDIGSHPRSVLSPSAGQAAGPPPPASPERHLFPPGAAAPTGGNSCPNTL